MMSKTETSTATDLPRSGQSCLGPSRMLHHVRTMGSPLSATPADVSSQFLFNTIKTL